MTKEREMSYDIRIHQDFLAHGHITKQSSQSIPWNAFSTMLK
jgi:hypothetical protein